MSYGKFFKGKKQCGVVEKMAKKNCKFGSLKKPYTDSKGVKHVCRKKPKKTNEIRHKIGEHQIYKGKKIGLWMDKKGWYHPTINGKDLHGKGIDRHYSWSSDAFVDAKKFINRQK